MNNILMKKERQLKILNSLDKLGYASRSQIQEMHDLKSTRNANRILKDMEEFLNVQKHIENVYYLNKKGRELIGSETKRTKSMQIEHHLMRTDMYIYFECPKKWDIEYQGLKEILIPDAFFLTDSLWRFLEVDNLQKMSNNVDKFKRYKKLKGMNIIQKKLGHFPTLVWYTTTELRREQLIKLANKYDVFCEVYTKKDLL